MYTDRIGRALELAARSHDRQYRKSPDKKTPYITHPVAVGLLLIAYGYDEETVIAGILHDTLEDTNLSIDTIRGMFGERVAMFVEQVTEPSKTHPWEERKRHYRERLMEASVEARAISCCDKLHNMRSIIASSTPPRDIWKRFKKGKLAQLEKFERLLSVYRGSLDADMACDYEETLHRLSLIE